MPVPTCRRSRFRHLGERTRIEVAAGAGATEVHLHGDLDISVEEELVARLADLAARGHPLVIDMANVTFLDSTGTRVLLIAQRACDDAGTRITLRKVPPAIRRTLEVAELDTILRIAD
jgi:anti-sigma B factor antagonist